jgi:predicted MPP superfamily phosphohydrolase
LGHVEDHKRRVTDSSAAYPIYDEIPRRPVRPRSRGFVLQRSSRAVYLLGAAIAGAAAAYMAFEAQWIHCRQVDLFVPGLPRVWAGVTILHLSDVHAGHFATNNCSLRKAVDWAAPLAPDLVFLTGDILGEQNSSRRCLDLLARLRPRLGAFAVTGNHDYGISKNPLAEAIYTEDLWAEAGITLLQDRCVVLPATARETPSGAPDSERSALAICGADYLSAGFPLLTDPLLSIPNGPFPILLVHQPPFSDSPLCGCFNLAFAGHTHGGQMRIPGRRRLVAFNQEKNMPLDGVHRWGDGLLIVSRGVGTSFVPFRLLTRPEATLWRLV